tara:strand:- start:492 stop:941 length:450 start_codon:yes stop_codon:yes gene_type:complete
MTFDIQKAAELISLSMTVPTVVLGIAVMHRWGPAALVALKENTLDSHGWFILGVVSSFLGSAFDNLYWSIAWTSSFYDGEYTNTLVSKGVYFNIVFRQGTGIFSAYCHLKAADMALSGSNKVANKLLAYSNIAAVLVGVGLGVYFLCKM